MVLFVQNSGSCLKSSFQATVPRRMPRMPSDSSRCRSFPAKGISSVQLPSLWPSSNERWTRWLVLAVEGHIPGILSTDTQYVTNSCKFPSFFAVVVALYENKEKRGMIDWWSTGANIALNLNDYRSRKLADVLSPFAPFKNTFSVTLLAL